jgi:hypothetical protein
MSLMLPYTRKEFLDSLGDGREVWICGERIKSIADPPQRCADAGRGRGEACMAGIDIAAWLSDLGLAQ